MRKTATKTNKINRKPPPAKMPPMIANGSPRYRRDNAMYTRPPAITQSENGFCRIRAHIPPVPATESPAAGRHGFRVLCGCGRFGQCFEASRTLARKQGAQTVLSETELGPLHARGSVRVGRRHQGRSAPEPATGR